MSDFLFELGTEELPPKLLNTLSQVLHDEVCARLTELGLNFKASQHYASPRRIALLIETLALQQADRTVERRGPALKVAFNAAGEPTPACLGFAKSCGVSVEDLTELKTDKGSWLVCKQHQVGAQTITLLPDIITQALKRLPVGKAMRWGSNTFEFIRPVHWLVMMLGDEIVPAALFNLTSGNQTYGHRFYHPEPITITQPKQYVELLAQTGKVAVDANKRHEEITKQIDQIVKSVGQAVMDENLLEEVASIVEWPTAMLATFDETFLALPQEAIISALQGHQKCFAVVDDKQTLLPYFILVSNIDPADASQVVQGNERVVRARLSDAMFFFEQDRKQPLVERIEGLKKVVYQEKLGSLYDKTMRIQSIARLISQQLVHTQDDSLDRAASLSKADLLSDLVGEFPELQGIAGSYYARFSGETEAVAVAIREHYQPRSASDSLPQTPLGISLALADRIDTLLSMFSIGLKPTGDKDPYGCRRAALGIIKICHAQGLTLDLKQLLGQQTEKVELIDAVMDFILDRLRVWYVEQYPQRKDIVKAVLNVLPVDLFDAYNRFEAVERFKEHKAAESLAAAHKRVSNILRKQSDQIEQAEFDPALMVCQEEKALYEKLKTVEQGIAPLVVKRDYIAILAQVASMRIEIDAFFTNVMVMDEDRALRRNRLCLLVLLSNLFLTVADIGELSTDTSKVAKQ